MTHATADRNEPSRAFGVMWLVLALALASNAVLGPLGFDRVGYPVPVTVRNQMIGLEAVTLALVVPMCVAAGLLALRGHPAAGAIGFGPAGYAAYTALQYVIGPEYGYYAPVVPLHLAIFSLGGAMAIWAWNAVSVRRLPPLGRITERRHGVILLGVAGFVLARYAGAIAGFFTGIPLPPAYQAAPAFYWSIFLLDIGVVVPATVLAAIALIRGAPYASTALYAVVGWFALVPPSVAAMALVMLISDDPYGSLAQVVILGTVAVVFGWWAIQVYRPLFTERATVAAAPAAVHDDDAVDDEDAVQDADAVQSEVVSDPLSSDESSPDESSAGEPVEDVTKGRINNQESLGTHAEISAEAGAETSTETSAEAGTESGSGAGTESGSEAGVETGETGMGASVETDPESGGAAVDAERKRPVRRRRTLTDRFWRRAAGARRDR